MPEIDIDFRFSDINYELWALAHFLTFIEEHIPTLRDVEKKKMLSRAQDEVKDYSDWILASNTADEIFEKIVPRLFRCPYIISLWSAFEKAVIEIAEYIRMQRNQDLRLNDIRGDFLSRTKRYFKSIVLFDFCLDDNIWEQLQDLACLRHIIAHANGRLSATNNKNQLRLKKLVEKDVGVIVEDDFLVISPEFLSTSYSLISTTLDDLLERVKAIFDDTDVA